MINDSTNVVKEDHIISFVILVKKRKKHTHQNFHYPCHSYLELASDEIFVISEVLKDTHIRPYMHASEKFIPGTATNSCMFIHDT